MTGGAPSRGTVAEEPPVGLIAGQGVLPLLVARGIRDAGRRIAGVGLRDQYDPALPELCDRFDTAGIVRLGRWIRLLRRAGAVEAVMVGRVAKARMHDPLRLLRQLPDWRAARLWYRRLRHDRRNAVLLAAVADELAAEGIRIIDSTRYIPTQMSPLGVAGAVRLSAAAEADVAFGWPLLRGIVELHVGQAIAVRDRDVIAVEAVEGTDGMIERAGALCRARGWTLLKTAARDHDMRADVPSVGTRTIELAAAHGCRCVAVGAGRVILLDRDAVVRAADSAGIALVGVADDHE